MAVVIVGAVLGGGVQALIAWRDRQRNARVAARVVWDTLTEGLMATHGKSPAGPPLYTDFAAYGDLWAAERRALGYKLSAEEFATIARAFARLRTLDKMDRESHDLRTAVFDQLAEAASACEAARRIAWARAQTGRQARAARKREVAGGYRPKPKRPRVFRR